MKGRNGSGRVKRGAVVNGASRPGEAGGAGTGNGPGATGGRDANGRPALVVCDLDGTLLDYHSTPVPGVLRAVAALRAAAVPIVICTGRAVAPTRALAVQLGLEHSVAIAYHGAVVVDVAGGRWLQRLDLPRQAIGPAVAALHGAGATLTAYVDDERWVQAGDEGAQRPDGRRAAEGTAQPADALAAPERPGRGARRRGGDPADRGGARRARRPRRRRGRPRRGGCARYGSRSRRDDRPRGGRVAGRPDAGRRRSTS